MSLFEAEVSTITSSFISTMNVMNANRATADMIEQLANLLRDANIANHPCLVVHAHYTPTQIDYRIIIYQRAAGLQRVFDMLGALIATQGGRITLSDEKHYKQKTIFLQLPEHHIIDLDFESDDITREMLADALKEKTAEVIL
jgi:hypothetical protein